MPPPTRATSLAPLSNWPKFTEGRTGQILISPIATVEPPTSGNLPGSISLCWGWCLLKALSPLCPPVHIYADRSEHVNAEQLRWHIPTALEYTGSFPQLALV